MVKCHVPTSESENWDEENKGILLGHKKQMGPQQH